MLYCDDAYTGWYLNRSFRCGMCKNNKSDSYDDIGCGVIVYGDEVIYLFNVHTHPQRCAIHKPDSSDSYLFHIDLDHLDFHHMGVSGAVLYHSSKLVCRYWFRFYLM